MIFTVYDFEATDKYANMASPIEVAYMNINENLEVLETGDLYFYDNSIPESKPGALAVHQMPKSYLAQYAGDFEANNRTLYRLFCRGNLLGFNNKAFDDHLGVNYLYRQGYDEIQVQSTRDLMQSLRPVFGKAPKLSDALAHFGLSDSFISMMADIYFKKDDKILRPHNAAYDTTATYLLLARCVKEGIMKLV